MSSLIVPAPSSLPAAAAAAATTTTTTIISTTNTTSSTSTTENKCTLWRRKRPERALLVCGCQKCCQGVWVGDERSQCKCGCKNCKQAKRFTAEEQKEKRKKRMRLSPNEFNIPMETSPSAAAVVVAGGGDEEPHHHHRNQQQDILGSKMIKTIDLKISRAQQYIEELKSTRARLIRLEDTEHRFFKKKN